jgi:outer membrane protein assembly factor BamB
MKQKFLIAILLIVLLTSCKVSPKNQLIKNENFPLSERWSFTSSVPIYKLAVGEGWIAVGEDDGITAIDINTGKFMWKLEFPLDTISELVFSEGNLIAANKDKMQIMAVNKLGKITSSFYLHSSESFQVLAAYSNYIFIRRVPSWNLEVYDMQSGNNLWEISVDRGSVSINYDSSKDNVYITTSSFVSARKIATGDEVWKINEVIRTGVLDLDTIYYYSEASNKGFVSAADAQNSEKIWKTEIPLDIRTSVYNLTALNDILFVSTDFGAIAINKKDGHEMWISETNDFFYGKPILINNVVYIRGASTKMIYAINPENGQYLGYLKLDKQSPLGLAQRNDDIVYKSGEFLIFPFVNTVYAYQIK